MIRIARQIHRPVLTVRIVVRLRLAIRIATPARAKVGLRVVGRSKAVPILLGLLLGLSRSRVLVWV